MQSLVSNPKTNKLKIGAETEIPTWNREEENIWAKPGFMRTKLFDLRGGSRTHQQVKEWYLCGF